MHQALVRKTKPLLFNEENILAEKLAFICADNIYNGGKIVKIHLYQNIAVEKSILFIQKFHPRKAKPIYAI